MNVIKKKIEEKKIVFFSQFDFFLFNPTEIQPRFVHVLEPTIEPSFYSAGPATFGPSITNNIYTGRVVQARPPTACSTILNQDSVIGRIALIDRGGCMFSEKVKYAQAAGATAVIICGMDTMII